MQQHRTEVTLVNLIKIKEWIETESIKVLPKSPIGKAMYYFQAQWPKLKKIGEDARYQLDNNLIENKIRPVAIGRKNYMFAGSHAGSERAAMMYSFIGSCIAQGINPAIWLEETLEKIPSHSISRLDELLPEWQS